MYATDNLAAHLNREIDHIIVGDVTANEVRTCRLDYDRQLSQVFTARNDEAKELLGRSEILAPEPIRRDGTSVAGHRFGRSPDMRPPLLPKPTTRAASSVGVRHCAADQSTLVWTGALRVRHTARTISPAAAGTKVPQGNGTQHQPVRLGVHGHSTARREC